MPVYTESFVVQTGGETDIIDITDHVKSAVKNSGLDAGSVVVWVAGSTAGISTVEYESGLVADLKEAYEHIAPRHGEYAHNLRWHDGNGYAHVRASMTGQDITIPFVDKSLLLGTWQQVILIDFDNRSRSREITVQVMGD